MHFELHFTVFVKQDILTEYLTRLVLFGNEFKPEFQFRKSSKFWQCLHMHSPPPPSYEQNELYIIFKKTFSYRHCISRFGQTCHNCASNQRPQRIVTEKGYRFGETPRSATPARYNSRLTPQNPHQIPYGHYVSQPKPNPDPYRYTYSYGSSSGQRKKRTSHFVHKLKMTVPRNVTARDNLLVLTPVLESLQKHFHYEILRGNKSRFAIKIKDGVSILYAKNPLEVGLHRLYIKGHLDNTKMKLAFDAENQIEFSGSGDEKKSQKKSKETEMPLSDVVGVSEARKFHLDLFIAVE